MISRIVSFFIGIVMIFSAIISADFFFRRGLMLLGYLLLIIGTFIGAFFITLTETGDDNQNQNQGE